MREKDLSVNQVQSLNAGVQILVLQVPIAKGRLQQWSRGVCWAIAASPKEVTTGAAAPAFPMSNLA
jgi:hypothetical protein